MRIGNGVLLAIGLAATTFGLAKLAFAQTTYCNGTISYFEGGWSFGCDGECPPTLDCEITRRPVADGYLDICACGGSWTTLCCHLIGHVTVIPGQQNTIQPAKAGDCNPPLPECPAGTCQFTVNDNGQGTTTITAECK